MVEHWSQRVHCGCCGCHSIRVEPRCVRTCTSVDTRKCTSQPALWPSCNGRMLQLKCSVSTRHKIDQVCAAWRYRLLAMMWAWCEGILWFWPSAAGLCCRGLHLVRCSPTAVARGPPCAQLDTSAFDVPVVDSKEQPEVEHTKYFSRAEPLVALTCSSGLANAAIMLLRDN
jgi:hypothetical protein